MKGRMGGAVLGVIVTLVIAFIGITTYSSGYGYMTFFGIELSPGVFALLIAAFIVWDIFAIRGALKTRKREEDAESARIDSLIKEETARVENAEKMSDICSITVNSPLFRFTASPGAEMRFVIKGIVGSFVVAEEQLANVHA